MFGNERVNIKLHSFACRSLTRLKTALCFCSVLQIATIWIRRTWNRCSERHFVCRLLTNLGRRGRGTRKSQVWANSELEMPSDVSKHFTHHSFQGNKLKFIWLLVIFVLWRNILDPYELSNFSWMRLLSRDLLIHFKAVLLNFALSCRIGLDGYIAYIAFYINSLAAEFFFATLQGAQR